jgi:hypothetical protein
LKKILFAMAVMLLLVPLAGAQDILIPYHIYQERGSSLTREGGLWYDGTNFKARDASGEITLGAGGGFDPTSNQTISGDWDFTGAFTANGVPVATTGNAVMLTGAQTITGIKTFDVRQIFNDGVDVTSTTTGINVSRIFQRPGWNAGYAGYDAVDIRLIPYGTNTSAFVISDPSTYIMWLDTDSYMEIAVEDLQLNDTQVNIDGPSSGTVLTAYGTDNVIEANIRGTATAIRGVTITDNTGRCGFFAQQGVLTGNNNQNVVTINRVGNPSTFDYLQPLLGLTDDMADGNTNNEHSIHIRWPNGYPASGTGKTFYSFWPGSSGLSSDHNVFKHDGRSDFKLTMAGELVLPTGGSVTIGGSTFPAPTNVVTLDGVQTVTGSKTFENVQSFTGPASGLFGSMGVGKQNAWGSGVDYTLLILSDPTGTGGAGGATHRYMAAGIGGTVGFWVSHDFLVRGYEFVLPDSSGSRINPPSGEFAICSDGSVGELVHRDSAGNEREVAFRDTANTYTLGQQFNTFIYANGSIRTNGSNELILQPASSQVIRLKEDGGSDAIVVQTSGIVDFPLSLTDNGDQVANLATAQTWTAAQSFDSGIRTGGDVTYTALTPTSGITDYVVLIDASSNTVNLTLTVQADQWRRIKATDVTNAVTLTPASGTIDGSATYTGLDVANKAVDVYCDGTNFYIF